MSDTSLMRYRVYCSEQEATTFPMDVLVEASYPAFCIISATAAASVALRQQYPVELLGDPSPPPVTPAVAGADQAVAKTQNRPPYLQVIRFQSPVRAEELQYVEATGCQLLTPIGSSTFVVRCPTKESLTQLKQLAGLAYVRDYVPEIQLNPDSFTGLNNTPALATIEAASASDSPAFKRSSANLALPGALVVSFFTGEDKTRAKRSLRRKKIGKLTDVGATTLVVDLSDSSQIANDLQAIITQPGLRSLQEQKLNRPFNNIARRLIAERVITDNPHGLGLTGHGEIVAVADSGLDTGDTNTIHLDFRGRVKHIRSFPIKPSASSQVQNPGADDGAADIYSGHGTHVAGSILGNGAKAKSLGVPEIQGVAPE
ncbi:MAG: S8 family serine peptidase, partial [Caldilineaceae bacterium]